MKWTRVAAYYWMNAGSLDDPEMRVYGDAEGPKPLLTWKLARLIEKKNAMFWLRASFGTW